MKKPPHIVSKYSTNWTYSGVVLINRHAEMLKFFEKLYRGKYPYYTFKVFAL